VDETLKFINTESLILIKKSWADHEEKRDNVMMDNIYNYCNKNHFYSGIFIIGSAHRKSIIEKIPVYNSREGIDICWNYCDYDKIL